MHIRLNVLFIINIYKSNEIFIFNNALMIKMMKTKCSEKYFLLFKSSQNLFKTNKEPLTYMFLLQIII